MPSGRRCVGDLTMSSSDSTDLRRAAARRTAWWIGLMAVGVYGMFIYLTARAS